MVEELSGLQKLRHGSAGFVAGVCAAATGYFGYTKFAVDMPRINSQINTDLSEIYQAMYGHPPKSAADLELFRNIVEASVGRDSAGTHSFHKRLGEELGFTSEEFEQAALKTGNAQVVKHPPNSGYGTDESGAPVRTSEPVPDTIETTPEQLMIELDQAWTLGVGSIAGVVVLGLVSVNYINNARRGWKA